MPLKAKPMSICRRTKLLTLELHLQHAIHGRRVLCLQKCDRDVMDRNASGSLSVAPPVVGMSVDDEISTMAVHHFRQTRRAKEGKNLLRFAFHRRRNGRVMQHDHSFSGAQL